MALYIHIGPSGSGKSHRLLRTVIDEAAKDMGRNVLLIVPEQVSMQATAQLVEAHPGHTIMNADVLSFMRLAYRVFDELGLGVPDVLDDTGKSMIAKKVALDLADKLTVYKGLVRRRGFIDELKSLICEFYQYGITDEDLAEVLEAADKSDRLFAKLSDVRILFNGFREFLKDKFVMNEELLDLLADAVGRSDVVRGSVMAFDGFTGFTAPQYRLMERLMSVARDIHVTVTMDTTLAGESGIDRENTMFFLSLQTIEKLKELGESAGQKVIMDCREDRGYRYLSNNVERRALAHLERNVFRYPVKKTDDHEGISIAECEDAETEIAYALTQMKKLVREEGLRYSEMAIVLADMKGMSAKMARGLKKAGIPYFMDDKKNILGTGPVEMIRAAIGVAGTDYAYDSVFRFVKALPDELGEGMDNVENYVRAKGIRGERRWNSEWKGKVYRRYSIDYDELNRKRQLVVDLLTPVINVLKNKNATVRDMVGAIKELLETCSVRERLEESAEKLQTSADEDERLRAREDAQLYDKIIGVLTQAGEMLGDDVITVRELADILDTGFSRQELALLPPSGDCVIVGDIERSRIGDVKALFVLGLGDDVIPAKDSSGTLLSESDREIFASRDITLAPTRRQAILNGEFYMYLCFAKPSQKLRLSYHMNNGRIRIRPAYVISAVTKIFEGLKFDHISAKRRELSIGIDGGAALLASLIGKKEPEGLSDETLMVLETIRKDQPEVFDKILEGAFYKAGGKNITPDVAKKIYGDVILRSVTSLEKYAQCAYSYFLKYGLRCEEEIEPGLAKTDFGTIYHKAIEVYGKKLRKNDITWHTEMEPERKKKFISEAIDEALLDYSEEIGETARSSYAKTRIEKVLGLTIDVIETQVRAGDFEPEYLEEGFGSASKYSGAQGRIDRIDVCRKNGRTFLRVVDYKTGNAEFDLNLLYHGIKVQLALYTKVAVELIKEKGEVSPEPVGAYYYKIDDPTVEGTSGMTNEAVFDLKAKDLRMSGPSDGETVKLISQDRGLEGNADELGASKKSKVLCVTIGKECIPRGKDIFNSGQFETIFGHVDRVFDDTANEIIAGKIPVNPYSYKNKMPCEFCPYHGICGYDEKLGSSARKIEELEPAKVFEMMENDAENEKKE
ncbi:MAG: PD-(D/E)XK nuclease family protein [Lachnospiraceae bacterium]|nr:PD-(D/E)XK nuclease family protein [Lachnospiraceae bacterium]